MVRKADSYQSMSCVSIVAVLYRTCVVPLRHHVRLLGASPTKWEGRDDVHTRGASYGWKWQGGCCSAKGQLWLEDEPKKIPPHHYFILPASHIYMTSCCVCLIQSSSRSEGENKNQILFYSSIEKRRRKTIECWGGTIRAALLMPTTRLLYRHEELTQKLRGGIGERTQL